METIVDMVYRKSTKGTHVYNAVQEDAAVTTLYIKREALPAEAPATITVKITTGD